jgi:hypothetical protein
MNCLARRRERALIQRRGSTLSEIRDCRAEFDEAVVAANAVNSPYSASLVTDVLARFAALDQAVASAKTKSDLETLRDQGAALARLRAYVCPPGEVLIRGQTALNTIQGWGVSKDELEALRAQVIPQLEHTTNAEAARGALLVVLEEYDSWSDHIDDYNDDMRRVAYALATSIVALLAAAIWLVPSGRVTWGLLAAGACGALVSVMSRLPTLQIFGDSAPYKRTVWRRACTGLAASVIGIGLLVSGTLPFSFRDAGSLPDMIEACANPATKQVPALETTAARAEESSKSVDGTGCKTRFVFILIAVVMLFGLSERALTSIEDRVFQAKS